MALPKLYTLIEVAEHFRVTAEAIRERVQAGTMPPPIKIANRLMWTEQSLEEFIADLQTKTAGDE